MHIGNTHSLRILRSRHGKNMLTIIARRQFLSCLICSYIRIDRYEDAAAELKTTLSNMLSPQALGDSIKLQTRPSSSVSAVNQLCAQQITDCYTSLQSWDEASNWLKEFDEMKIANGTLAGIDPLGHCDK